MLVRMLKKYHVKYSDESLREHREYLKEIIKYLKKHPEEEELYLFVSSFQYAVGREDPLYARVYDLFAEDPWSKIYSKQYVYARNGYMMGQKEFHDYFVKKFPQWKDIYYY